MRRWLTLGLVAGILSGCSSAPTYRPRSLQTVALARDRPAALEMEVVTGVRVVLPAPDPGYIWEIIANNTKVLPQTSALRADPGGATESVTFYAARPGRSVLRFALVHPRDLDAVPAAKASLTVHISD